MFMNAAPVTADREQDLAQRDPERFRLLGLVRQLMDFGRDLIATLQTHNSPTAPTEIARRFGSVALALIITRITRGLMIAAALEKRLLHPRPRGVNTNSPAHPAPPRAPRAPRQPRHDEEAELLAGLPSAKEIAARLRNRKTGAVIAEICRDLGIACDHKLWRQINDAIIFHGGNLVKLMRVWFRRAEKTSHLPPTPEEEARYDQFIAAVANTS